jgi:hypothetical protein
MDEKVIVCEHYWSPWFLGKTPERDWRTCKRCQATHYQCEAEPRSIMARIQDP